MKLYHKDVFMPSAIADIPTKIVPVKWTQHATIKAQLFNIPLCNEVVYSGKDIIEAEVHHGHLTKIMIRKRYDAKYDLCLVLRAIMQGIIVVTVWLNDKNDMHCTLDDSRYDR